MAKLNKKLRKKIFFRSNFFEKNLENCLFSGQNTDFSAKTDIFVIFSGFFFVFDFGFRYFSGICRIKFENKSYRNVRVSSPLNPMLYTNKV